jgi:hypothetical protein
MTNTSETNFFENISLFVGEQDFQERLKAELSKFAYEVIKLYKEEEERNKEAERLAIEYKRIELEKERVERNLMTDEDFVVIAVKKLKHKEVVIEKNKTKYHLNPEKAKKEKKEKVVTERSGERKEPREKVVTERSGERKEPREKYAPKKGRCNVFNKAPSYVRPPNYSQLYIPEGTILVSHYGDTTMTVRFDGSKFIDEEEQVEYNTLRQATIAFTNAMNKKSIPDTWIFWKTIDGQSIYRLDQTPLI